MKIYLGDRLYRYLDEEEKEIENIRISKIKNEKSYIAIIEDTKEKIQLSKEELETYYTRIIPDGTLVYTIVNLELGLKDVIVSLYKTKELKDGDKLPFCACRQSVTDLFVQTTNNSPDIFAGMSVSKTTMPDNVPYEMILGCNGIEWSRSLSVYLDDSLEYLLSMVNTSKMDAILLNMATQVKPNVKGYCKSVRQLLEENDFMYDYLSAFNINTVNFKVENINDELPPDQVYALEERYKVEMFKTYVIPYDRTIDISEIKRNYVMISDIENKIYIIAYDKGEYINRTYKENIKDQRELRAMVNNKIISK